MVARVVTDVIVAHLHAAQPNGGHLVLLLWMLSHGHRLFFLLQPSI
jgi:hypothetical protein